VYHCISAVLSYIQLCSVYTVPV